MSLSMTKNTLFAAALAMASTASAHMTMSNPVPFGSPSKSPLDASGSNFPCQVGPGGAYAVTSMNEWTVGSDVTLTFVQNSASHSGGSCQVSVTKDKEPTPQSVWKVIHSIEGGCPTAEAGNSENIASFPFTVPSELPEGQMTMAWTWFNKSGNREMYMNCAPIKVSGGSGDGFDSLPDMAVANIAAGQGSCATTETFDYTFANPGKYVTKAGKGPYKELCGGAASEGGSTGGSAPSSGSGSAPTPPKEPTSAPAPPKEPASAPAPPKEPASVPEASTPKAPSTGGSSGSSSGGASGGSSCSEEGALMCKGESMFGLCSNGAVVYMPVAAGTKCQNGVIARRSDMHRNHRRSYIHRNQRRSI